MVISTFVYINYNITNRVFKRFFELVFDKLHHLYVCMQGTREINKVLVQVRTGGGGSEGENRHINIKQDVPCHAVG